MVDPGDGPVHWMVASICGADPYTVVQFGMLEQLRHQAGDSLLGSVDQIPHCCRGRGGGSSTLHVWMAAGMGVDEPVCYVVSHI